MFKKDDIVTSTRNPDYLYQVIGFTNNGGIKLRYYGRADGTYEPPGDWVYTTDPSILEYPDAA